MSRNSNSNSTLDSETDCTVQGMRAVQGRRRHHLNQNTRNTTVSEEVREILRSRLSNEYNLYHFIIKLLRTQISECVELNKSS